MHALTRMTFVEVKLFLREPAAVFFTLAFPVMILVLFTTIFGNEEMPGSGGASTVDVMAPAYTALVVGSISLIGLPTNLATYRERGILRRLRATPVHPSVVLVAQVLTQLLMTALGVALLLTVARLAYGLQVPAAPLSVVPAFVLASLSFFTVGFVVAGLTPTVRVAEVAGQSIFFPMLFLSGAVVPRAQFPETVELISEFLPLTHFVTLVQDLWLGEGWNATAVLVLAGVLVAGVIVSARTFRWE